MKCVSVSAVLFGFAASLSTVSGQQLPVIRSEGSAQQLIVQGKPFLILGGELGNSTDGTAAQAHVILPKLATLHFNTVLMPVAWDQIEPAEEATSIFHSITGLMWRGNNTCILCCFGLGAGRMLSVCAGMGALRHQAVSACHLCWGLAA